MTSKQLAEDVYRKLYPSLIGDDPIDDYCQAYPYFVDCIEEIAKQMYEDLKHSDIDLDYDTMDVVLYKIGEKLNAKHK